MSCITGNNSNSRESDSSWTWTKIAAKSLEIAAKMACANAIGGAFVAASNSISPAYVVASSTVGFPMLAAGAVLLLYAGSRCYQAVFDKDNGLKYVVVNGDNQGYEPLSSSDIESIYSDHLPATREELEPLLPKKATIQKQPTATEEMEMAYFADVSENEMEASFSPPPSPTSSTSSLGMVFSV